MGLDVATAKEALQKLRNALSSGEPDEAHEALSLLTSHHRSRWRFHVLNHGGLPNPEQRSFARSAETLSDGLTRLIGASGGDTELFVELVRLLHSLCLFEGIFKRLRAELETLAFWSASPATQLFRLCTFYETQATLLASTTLDGTTFTPDKALVPKDSGPASGVATADNYEAMTGAIEAVLRYILHRSAGKETGTVDTAHSPYEDPDFHKLLLIGNSWETSRWLWGRIRYQDWRVTRTDDADFVVPPDKEEYLRAEVGLLRERLADLEAVAPLIAAHAGTDTASQLQTLSQSISLPEYGEAWDGEIDVDCLAAAAKTTFRTGSADILVAERHYAPLVDDVRLGEHQRIDWPTWLHIFGVVHVLADALRIAIQARTPNEPAGSVVVCRTETLVELVSAATRFDHAACEYAVRALTFDPTRKQLDAWDMPLVPFGDHSLLLVPSLIVNGSHWVALENYVSERGGEQFAWRSELLEGSIEEVLRAHDAEVVIHVEFEASDGRRVEYDILALWEAHLFVIEAKCLKAIFSPADYGRAKAELSDGIAQVERRLGLISTDWDTLRATSKLPLPESRENLKVHGVVVTNIRQFSGCQSSNTTIIDEACFRRYFGDKDVVAQHIVKNKIMQSETVVRLREAEPNPADFWRYLESPPQLSRLRNRFTLQSAPAFSSDDVRLGFIRAVFAGILDAESSGDEPPRDTAQDSSTGS